MMKADDFFKNSKLMYLSLGLFVLAALFASGYHHPDEYMQIIEFANVKLEGRSAIDLPWEYHETMRSWFQPSLFVALASILKFLGVSNPFVIWTAFRVLLGLLGWVALYNFTQTGQQYFEKTRDQKTFILSCFFLFFMPWLMTRSSSESLSATLILLSATTSLRANSNNKMVSLSVAGFLMGLAFLSRFQSAFMGLGFLLWMIFIQKEKFKFLLSYVVAGFVALVIGVLIDSWGYERFTFSAFHYFYQNIVLNKAAQWGVKPFWYYLVLMQSHGMPLHSLILTGAFLYSVFRFRKNPFVWMAVPFVIVHSIVGHKEMRFLFPVAVFSPLFLVLAFQEISNFKRLAFLLNKPILIFFVGLNLFALIFMTLWPSRTEVLLQRILYKESPGVLFYLGKNPYSLGDHPVYFTKRENMKVESVRDLNDFLNIKTGRRSEKIAFVTTRYDSIEFRDLESVGCHKEWQVFPNWVGNLLPPKAIESAGNYTLFVCR